MGAVNSPVSGIKLKRPLLTFGGKGPEAPVTKVGYMDVAVTRSSVIRMFTVFCASIDEVALPVTSPVRGPVKPLAVSIPVAGT